MRLAVTVAAIAALGLAACGENAPATTDGATATPAAAEPAAPVAAATAPDMEGPAAGRWSVTVTAMGQTMPATETCYAKQTSIAESQKMQQQAGIECSEQSYKREGDAIVGHSVCTSDVAGKKMTITSDMRVTGDFNTRYTMDMTNRMDPPPMPGMEEQKIIMTAERLGDC